MGSRTPSRRRTQPSTAAASRRLPDGDGDVDREEKRLARRERRDLARQSGKIGGARDVATAPPRASKSDDRRADPGYIDLAKIRSEDAHRADYGADRVSRKTIPIGSKASRTGS